MLRKIFRERTRSKTVRAIGLSGGAAEPGLERYVEQAAHAFAAPAAAVSLIHAKQQFVAMSSDAAPQTCFPRRQSICNHALDTNAVLEVCDARRDARFAHLPSVAGEPHIRYYIGAALSVSGVDVGVLCVLDTHERPSASPDQRAYLAGLARQVSAVLERRLLAAGSLAA